MNEDLDWTEIQCCHVKLDDFECLLWALQCCLASNEHVCEKKKVVFVCVDTSDFLVTFLTVEKLLTNVYR